MSDLGLGDYITRSGASASTLAGTTARNQFAKLLARQRGARKQFELGEQYRMKTPGFISGYVRRGLAGPGVRSGIYSGALQDLAKRRMQQEFDIASGTADELFKYGVMDADALAQYQQDISKYNFDKTEAIKEAAGQLIAFKPFTGG